MPFSLLVALGSNRGDRGYNLLRAIDALSEAMRIVRVSSTYDTEPVDAPAGSPRFLNMVVAGYTSLAPLRVLDTLLAIEKRLGRLRTGVRNEPRIIDLDLIFHSAHVMRSASLTLPHPRYRDRDFVRVPMSELRLGWRDPVTGEAAAR